MEKRNRNIRKQVWLNREEATLLSKKSKKAGLNESVLIRNLINGYEPREKPDDRFYEVMKDMRSIGNNLNQITKKLHSLGFIDQLLYQKESEKWNKFMTSIKTEYLYPGNVNNK